VGPTVGGWQRETGVLGIPSLSLPPPLTVPERLLYARKSTDGIQPHTCCGRGRLSTLTMVDALKAEEGGLQTFSGGR